MTVANDGGQALAPWPVCDKWPVLLGSSLTVQYLASVYRLCLNGYRQQYVDVLNELLDKDPHAFAVLSQRMETVAGADVEFVAAVTDQRSEEQHGNAEASRAKADAERAEFIRVEVEKRFRAIPCMSASLFSLLIAVYYGVSAAEIAWDCRGERDWWVAGLGMIHSRRIAYPDQNSWAMHIWDQGSVMPGSFGTFPTEKLFGLRPIDVPGKFISFTPQYRADYPTREGLGREIAWYMAIKSMGVRGASAYVERFAKPFVQGKYNTKSNSNTNPRVASDADIAVLDQATRALGVGTLNAATLPDSVEVVLSGPGFQGAAAGMDHAKLIELCNSEISKAVRGSTLTTDTGKNGNKDLGQVHAESDVRNARFDAAQLRDCLQRDLIDWISRLNFPGEEHFYPQIQIHVEKLDPDALLDRAIKMAGAGAPVDARWLSAKVGIRLVDPKDENAIRMAPVKPVDVFALEGAQAGDFREAIEAMAGITGMHLTPGQLDTIAALPPQSAAQIIRDLLQAAKANAYDRTHQPKNSTAGDEPTPDPTDDATEDGDEPVPQE